MAKKTTRRPCWPTHVQGIKGIYHKHDYMDEKREALLLWGARLRSIVNPQPSNVVKLRA